MQKYIAANVNSAMTLWASKDPETVNAFRELHVNIIKEAVKETIEQLGESSQLPLKAFYSEEEACEFLQKGPQYFKTRRANKKTFPKPIDTGSGFIYSLAELLRFADEIGPTYEPHSKDILMEEGLEAVSLAVSYVDRKIKARLKARVQNEK